MRFRGILAIGLALGFVLPATAKAKKKPVPVTVTPVAPPVPAEPPDNRLTLEKFEGVETEADLLARGWKGGQEKNGKLDHSIVKDGGRSVLRESHILNSEALYRYKEIEWDVAVYPYLTWRWRAQKFPKGAKVLDSKVSDAVAQVYVLWKKGRRSFVIKYFWSGGDEPGDTINQSNFIFGKLYGLVLRNTTTVNEWFRETRNVREDYRLAFGEYPSTNARGFGVLSDGDETNTESEADYADFEALKISKNP